MSSAGSASARSIDRVAVIGAGAIGASWSALFAAHGIEVAATDPRPEAADELHATVERCWGSLERLGMVADGASPELVSFVGDDVAAACDGVGFVQENAPERLELKHDLYRELDAATDSEVVLASSSSGLTASDIQSACKRHPERVVIGHPFNPPHLVPLVEVVGGSATGDAAIDTAIGFYERCGKTPIRINAELPGHVTNRLQSALWREAYWLVNEGIVSVADIDKAISNGPGLRWALLGPFATQHFSGGPGGIDHILEHLGPPMVEYWNSMHQPEWNDSLKVAISSGVADSMAGLDQAEVLAERDRLLEQLLLSKRGSTNP